MSRLFIPGNRADFYKDELRYVYMETDGEVYAIPRNLIGTRIPYYQLEVHGLRAVDVAQTVWHRDKQGKKKINFYILKDGSVMFPARFRISKNGKIVRC